MRNRKFPVALALAGGLAFAGCERAEPEEEPTFVEEELAEQRGDVAKPNEAAEARPERVQPAVAVAGVGIDCAPTPVFFEQGSAELDDDDRTALTALAQCLKAAPEGESVRVSGLTTPREPEDYDEQLAAQRATNVVSFLRLQGATEANFEIRAVDESGTVEGMPVLYPSEGAAMARERDRDITEGGEPTQRERAK